MKCNLCNEDFVNAKGISNHTRWKHKILPFQERYREQMKQRQGESNPNYNSLSESYDTFHQYVRRHKKQPDTCQNCGKKESFLDLAFKNHKLGRTSVIGYTRNFNDWLYLCRSCHMHIDGRIKNLLRGNNG